MASAISKRKPISRRGHKCSGDGKTDIPTGAGSLSHETKGCLFACFGLSLSSHTFIHLCMYEASMIKTTILNPLNKIKVSLFHSTPVLDRKRRTHWNINSGGGGSRDSTKRYNQYAKRFRKLNSKQELLRNVGAFAEQLFQNWQTGSDDKDNREKSWFKREFEPKSSKGPYSRRGFDFCDDDDSDVETVFGGSFRGGSFFHCSFVDDEFFGSRGFSRHSNNFRNSWKWRYVDEEEDYDSTSESDSSESDRLALGLCASGPLKIEDVKTAYRVCALKWHPDRHQGKSKAVAEEKFKACSAAYQSLCDKLS